MTLIEDETLLEWVLDPERKAEGFSLLVTKYQKKIYWVIRRIVYSHEDTDDLLQETFIKVWNNVSQFKRNSSLYTWIYKIAINESLNHLRKQKKIFSNIEDVSSELCHTYINDFGLDGESIEKMLYLAITKLPHKQKTVFELRYFEEMSYEAMSDCLNTSIGSLKASFHHAVEKVEKTLKSHLALNIKE